ncbi:glycylpeptide N-tetradecanoyltransferase [Dispira simplex]|nr:glycylpeptide N-tetradecanoyltransferase [Dispira simplex]
MSEPNKKPNCGPSESTDEGKTGPATSSNQTLREAQIQALLQRLSLVDSESQPPKEHKFWKTQPVPQVGEAVDTEGPIKPDVPVDQVRQEPLPLPEGFEWTELDLTDSATMTELYQLLTHNYVEDDDAMFRFDYSPEFLQWGLKPPGWKPQWNIGVKVTTSKRLVAFISGIPVTLKVRSHTKRMVEINFMCVHKKLRSKRLAPVLIKEITRRVNVGGIFQAVYTAGAVLPTPLSVCRYYHRSLNPKKLVETGFSYLPPKWTMTQLTKHCEVPATPSYLGLRLMKQEDIPQVRSLINDFNDRNCLFAPVFDSDEEVSHWLLPVDQVVWTYVAESTTEPGKITDLASFYSLPSSVINHATHKHVKAAYLFYYATDADLTLLAPTDRASDSHTVTSTANHRERVSQCPQFKSHFVKLGQSLLTLARQNGFDVFNCLEMNYNHLLFDELKFKPGDGYLKYYMYNWRCPKVEPDQVGLVML